MTVDVDLPDDLVKQIDHVSAERSAFVTEAVKRMLRDAGEPTAGEVERINAIAEELNREAEDVLAYH